MLSRNFNLRNQQSNKNMDDYASNLNHLCKQAYPEEGIESTVLLQRFLTRLRPTRFLPDVVTAETQKPGGGCEGCKLN